MLAKSIDVPVDTGDRHTVPVLTARQDGYCVPSLSRHGIGGALRRRLGDNINRLSLYSLLLKVLTSLEIVKASSRR